MKNLLRTSLVVLAGLSGLVQVGTIDAIDELD
jgi:hypothetical protein